MRKAALPVALVIALALTAAACGGGGSDTLAGQSGQPGAPETTTSAPTTVAEAPTTTLPEQVVEVPDISDLGLTWDEEPVVEATTGAVSTTAFNEYLFESAPNLMVPEGTLTDDTEKAEYEAVLAEALPEAPRKVIALFLGLEPDDPDVQMLVSRVDGPESARIVVIQTQEDDSVRALRWEFTVQMLDRTTLQPEPEQPAGETTDTTAAAGEEVTTTTAPEVIVIDWAPVVYTGSLTTQCQPGRGHQDFVVGECV